MNRKIRVLHTFNIMNRGGAETLIMNLYRNIDHSIYEFIFLCESHEKGDYDDEIDALGGKIFHLSQDKKRPILNIINIVKFLKKNGPFDVVHLPNMFYSGIFCISAKIAGVNKIVVHSHSSNDNHHENLYRKFYRFLMKFFINRLADIKISCGEEAAKFLFGKKENVIILNNGADIEKFNQKYNVDYLIKEFELKNEKIIGNIARFEPVKNHIFFIKLGMYIKKNNLDYKILLVGDGSLKEKIEKEVHEKKLEGIIKFAGLRTDIPQLLKIIDVIVMPSIFEGFPLTVVESLASGTPCVLSNTIDHKAAIIDKMVKFADINDDIDVWIKQIEGLIDKKNNSYYIRKKLIELGFDIKSTTKKIEEIYRNDIN